MYPVQNRVRQSQNTFETFLEDSDQTQLACECMGITSNRFSSVVADSNKLCSKLKLSDA